jgi:hypothetical protein
VRPGIYDERGRWLAETQAVIPPRAAGPWDANTCPAVVQPAPAVESLRAWLRARGIPVRQIVVSR